MAKYGEHNDGGNPFAGGMTGKTDEGRKGGKRKKSKRKRSGRR